VILLIASGSDQNVRQLTSVGFIHRQLTQTKI
jgi:hypothetical protein